MVQVRRRTQIDKLLYRFLFLVFAALHFQNLSNRCSHKYNLSISRFFLISFLAGFCHLAQLCEARSNLWPFCYVWDRQHILAPVLEDEHAKTVASSSEAHHIVYPRSLSRATSVEPRSHHETPAFRGYTHRLWTSSSTGSTALPASTTRRRSSLSRLYWWPVLQFAVRTRRWKGSSKRRRTTTSTTEVKKLLRPKKNRIK